MRLTTKGRFAVTAMIDLALRQENGPVTLAGISQRQDIFYLILSNYLASCAVMRSSNRYAAPGGGYHLARKAQNVTVADIIIAVDEPSMRLNAAVKVIAMVAITAMAFIA